MAHPLPSADLQEAGGMTAQGSREQAGRKGQIINACQILTPAAGGRPSADQAQQEGRP